MAITREEISFSGHGRTFDGVMVWDDAEERKRPGVLVCHAWGGRAEHDIKTAERLAALGYVALAGDVYGDGRRGESPEECTALMTPLMEDRAQLLEILKLNIAQLADYAKCSGEIGVAGFCFGGLCALDLARANAGVKGAVAFHSLLSGAALSSEPITAKVLALQGYDDPMAGPDDQRAFAEEMTSRDADWQLHLYGGVVHAFTNEGANNPDLGLRHDAVAAARSYDSMAGFFAEVLG